MGTGSEDSVSWQFWYERPCRSVTIFQPAKYLADSARGLTAECRLDFLFGDGSLIEVFDQNTAIFDDFFFGALAVARYLRYRVCYHISVAITAGRKTG